MRVAAIPSPAAAGAPLSELSRDPDARRIGAAAGSSEMPGHARRLLAARSRCFG